jgi:hypothetical protein
MSSLNPLQGMSLLDVRRKGVDVLQAGAFRLPAIAANLAGLAMIAEGGLQLVGATLATLRFGNPVNGINNFTNLVSDKTGVNVRPFNLGPANLGENWFDSERILEAVKLIAKGIFTCFISNLLWDFSVVIFDKAPQGFYNNAMTLSPFMVKNDGGCILPYGRVFSWISGN